MTTGSDVVYNNTGLAKSQERGDKLHAALEGEHDDKTITKQLLADAHKGTPAEQRAFWQHMQVGNGTANVDAHLPKGFSVSGEDGKHVVTEKVKGKDGKERDVTVYDEAKTAAAADKDSKIHRGEGPYAAFRRQGMTDAEAKAAAADVKATTGKGSDGFKQNESYTQDDKGQGNWHKTERDLAAAKAAEEAERVAAAKKAADLDLATKLKNKGLDEAKAAVETGTKSADAALTKWGAAHFSDPYLTKANIDADLKRTDLPADEKAGLTYMKDHFDKMSKPSPSGYDPFIDAAGIAAFRKAQETEIANLRPKVAAS